MSKIFVMVLETLMLVMAISLDSFVASFAYGSNKIKIPLKSVLIINLIGSLIFALSLSLGSILSGILSQELERTFSFLILFILGLVKLCDSTIKAFIRRSKRSHKKVSFSMLNLHFILEVYADPEEADADMSKVLSPTEAASLAVALSLDSMGVGIGAALVSINYLLALLLSFLVGIGAVKAGCYLGNKAAEKISLDLSWLSGVLLMILAILKFK